MHLQECENQLRRGGCSVGGAGSRLLPPQLLFCGSCPQAGGIHICIIHIETPSLPPNQCRRGLHRYLSASRVSLSFFVFHSVTHWYLSAKGGLLSCPPSIVFILALSSSHPDSNISTHKTEGKKSLEKIVIQVCMFSKCLLLKSNSWHYTLNMCSFDIKQTDESKTCWMLEIK